jgi:ATP-dependent protease ClpP protease subunit
MKQLNLSGIIGWDVTADDIRTGLVNANGDDVELLVSSPGGLVSTCLEIFNLIRNYPGHVTARLVGFAMSAASYIPLAADRIIAEDNAVYMIHNVHGGVFGDHNYILKYGNVTRDLSIMLSKAYTRHTGKDEAEIQSMMDEETYFYGQGIVDAGFAHELAATDNDDDQASAMAIARTAFAGTAGKLAADIKATADDLTRAVALAPSSFTNHRASAPAQPSNKEQKMDLKTLKEKHQDLVAAITDEATAKMAEQIAAALAEGKTEGAKQERLRMEDVRAQLIPGHEKLIETMAADGVSTGADAAKAIVAAEKALRNQAADYLNESANPVVPPAGNNNSERSQLTRAEFNKLTALGQADFCKAGGTIKD